jgi:hypothetical protein
MTLRTTSLLLAVCGLVFPPKNPNLSLWNGKDMHVLAELSAVRAPKQSHQQLPLFELPTIAPVRQFPDIQETSDSLASTLPLPQLELEKFRRLPLEYILAPKTNAVSERVCARLVQAEAHEPNTSLRSDYRQAFICVSLAAKNNPQAFVDASYAVQRCHPDQVWPRIVAQRKAMLGKEYPDFFFLSNDMPRPDVKRDTKVIYDLPSSADGLTNNLTQSRDGRATVNGVGYSADSSSAAPSTAQPAAEAGEGFITSSGAKQPSPAPLIHEKERRA